MNTIILIGIISIVSYIVGSIPSAYWYSIFLYNIDLTQQGSLNPGATNCARVLGTHWHFFIIFLFDCCKSFFTLSLVQKSVNHQEYYQLLAASLLLIGNGYSCFLRGKGGKGVATFVGIISALHTPLLFYFIPTWTLLKTISTSSAFASLATVSSLPLYYAFIEKKPNLLLALFLTFAALWIILRHKNNIIRYLNPH